MFKGMQRSFLCVCLLVLLAAPAAYAGTSGPQASPLDSVSFYVSDILAEVWQGLNDLWHSAFSNDYAHDGYEADETTLPPLEDGNEGGNGGASTQSAGGDPPPPPGGENDDDGNIGGGSDPWG